MDQRNRKNTYALQAGAAALVVIIYFAVVFYNKKHGTPTVVANNTGSTEQANQTQAITDSEDTQSTESDNTATNTPPTTTPPPAQTPPTTPPPVQTSTYKDGIYTATGSYVSPGGQQSVTVTLTVKNDVVTAASVTPHAVDSTSAQFQQEFVSNFRPLVVGKDLSTLSLHKVAGSSLTSTGFNNAVSQIKAQAS